MTDHTNTYPDLVNVEDWLNAKGYTGEAGACHQAMSLIRSQEKRIAELTAALKPFADEAEIYNRTLVLGPDIDHWVYDGERITFGDLRAAAAALKETDNA